MVNDICETYYNIKYPDGSGHFSETFNECPENPALCNCTQYPGVLQPDPDVGGTGVLIGFVGTAWLVVILAIFRYTFAYDPQVNPFEDKRETSRGHADVNNSNNHRKANPVDEKMVGWFRKKFGRVHREAWEESMRQVVLVMADIQLLTGFGVLLSGVIPLRTYISAYHWQVVVRLVWFSNLTHAACLTALRRHFHENQARRNWRLTLMVLLLVGLIVSILPTAYFNWPHESDEGSAAMESSNARCYFDRILIPKMWCPPLHCLSNSPEDSTACERLQDSKFSRATAAYESHILSILILVVNFTTRVLKLTKTLSTFSRNYLRSSLSRLFLAFVIAVNKWYQQLSSRSMSKRLCCIFRPLDLLLGCYLTAKFYLDVVSSELFDVYSLLASAVWGTLQLFSTSLTATDNERTEWTFGQILPVFLLAGPLASIALSMPIKPLEFIRRLCTPLKTPRAWVTTHMSGANTNELGDLSQIGGQESSTSATRVELMSGTDAVGPSEDLRNDRADIGAENESVALEGGVPPERRNGSKNFKTFNQELISAEDDADTIKSHLCNYYLRSGWMSFCFAFVWLQVMTLTVAVLVFLFYEKPSSTLSSVAFIGLVLQPIALFSVITVGLYVTDHHSSKLFSLFPAILHLLLLGLIIGGFLAIFLGTETKTTIAAGPTSNVPFEAKVVAFTPFILLLGLSFYLNVVK